MRFWRRRPESSETRETLDQIVERLIKDGFLEQEVRLTEKSRALLSTNQRDMDDYTYWCIADKAREAQAIVNGVTDVAQINGAVIGAGTFLVEGDALDVDIALTKAAVHRHAEIEAGEA